MNNHPLSCYAPNHLPFPPVSDQNFVTLAVADGTEMRAYTAFPSSTGPVPGIILLQEAFGVTTTFAAWPTGWRRLATP